jgi:adenylyl-sulfate kinase
LNERHVTWQQAPMTRARRWGAAGLEGATVWFTGLPAAGKSTLAGRVEERLIDLGRRAYLLDGDNIRHGLCADLGFSRADRDENVRRVGEVARLFADSGTIALVALVSPYRAERHFVRELHERDGLTFLEVFVNTPLQECTQRDPKGLYRRAQAGELQGVTGWDAPYEPPEPPQLEICPALALDAAAEAVLAALAPPPARLRLS